LSFAMIAAGVPLGASSAVQAPLVTGDVADPSLDVDDVVVQSGVTLVALSDGREFGQRRAAMRQLGEGGVGALQIEQAQLYG